MSSPFEQNISKDRLFNNDQADGYDRVISK